MNKIYPGWRRAYEDGDPTADPKSLPVRGLLLRRREYRFGDRDLFLSEIPPSARVVSATLTDKLWTDRHVLHGSAMVFKQVAGAQFDVLVLWLDSGDPATSRLVVYLDEGVDGFPLTPVGGDVILEWSQRAVFELGPVYMREGVG